MSKLIHVNCGNPLFHAVAEAVVVCGDNDRRMLSEGIEAADRLITDDFELAKRFDAANPKRGRVLLIITAPRSTLKDKLEGFHGSIVEWTDGTARDSESLDNCLSSGGM